MNQVSDHPNFHVVGIGASAGEAAIVLPDAEAAEELKACNEELPAINEQLRSTTEALETRKKELQSINEELIARNHELKLKADETAKLQEEGHRMRLVAASTEDYAIITQDMEGWITSWNIGASRIFGYEEAEAIGQPVDILFTPEDRERGVPQEEMQSARTNGSAVDERWHVRRDGSRFFCSGVTTLLDSGEIRGYARIARDLTGAREADWRREQTLARETATRIQAENASRMREEFLAVLSHELKQPLNLIHLNAECLKRMPDSRNSESILRVVDTIRAAATSQATIINDLLDWSRVSTGKLALNKAPFDLAPVVARLVDVFAEEASGKGVSLIYRCVEREIWLLADVTRIEQIVWNLLSNAIKFTTGGGRVNLSLSIQDDMACIQVSDSGKGIKHDFLPHVFEMFNQADGSITREHGGLGIGLALVKQLVDSHKGRVVAASEGPERGAEFTVWLPLIGAAAGAPAFMKTAQTVFNR